jgi:hypothetical protein
MLRKTSRTNVVPAVALRIRLYALYRCPNTGDSAQAWAADDPEDDDLTFVQVTCLACAQTHLVNPKTGRVLGFDDE